MTAVIATVFVGMLGSLALAAQASWNATCSSGGLCNYRYVGFVVPLAATAGSDSDYTNDKYPNTQVVLNDTVRSAKNRFGQKDVVWYESINYTGAWSLCVNPGWVVSDMAGYSNQASSHLVAAATTC